MPVCRPTQHLVEILEKHPRRESYQFVFPSPTGNREQHMLDRCKAVAKRAGLNREQFDLKTFRSTYATRMLRGRIRRKNGAALDGTQIIGDHNALFGPSYRGAR
jgi:integrase